MKPVIQQETTGCGIASTAAIAGISYFEAKRIANRLGIYAEDPRLWSDTNYVRKLLKHLGVGTKPPGTFHSWAALPDTALLAIKWHMEKGRPYWHWVVFVRDNKQEYVIDSRKGLKNNKRTDFGRMRPKWFIEVCR